MKLAAFIWFTLHFNNIIPPLESKNMNRRDVRRFIDMIQRRQYASDEGILDIPRSVEDLPEAEPIHPGHTLLQPSRGMLKSSVKFPQKDAGDMAVYGNLKNLGITFGKTRQRLLYTNFRKTDNILTYLLERAIRNIQNKKHSTLLQRNPVIVIEIDPALQRMTYGYPFKEDSKELYIENKASEAVGSNEANEEILSPSRRKLYKPTLSSKLRGRDYSSDSDTSKSASDASDYERNPGNPYTVHKDKYRQNWMWNHFMDGNHMNVNPYAPQFNSMGPSGAALFFGRKWWYYNQDDYQPLS